MSTTSNLVATEEIRDTLGLDFPQGATAAQLADSLAISVSTARRHARLLTERGWAEAVRQGRLVLYTLTDRGRDSYRNNEGL